MGKKLRYILSATLLILVILWQCRQAGQKYNPAEQQGGSIRVGLTGNITELFPLTLTEYNAQSISRHLLHPALVELRPGGEVIVGIARGWYRQDSTTVHVYLNPAIRWDNGSVLSAADVVSTVGFIRQHAPELNRAFRDFNQVSASAEDSFHVVFKKPAGMPEGLLSVMPILPEALIEAYGIHPDSLRQAYNRERPSYGPFVVSGKSSSEIQFRRNSGYQIRPVQPDSIFLHLYSGVDSLMTDMLAEKLHFIADFPADRLGALVPGQQPYLVETSPEDGFTCLAWNLEDELLKRRELRLALSLAANRQAFVDGIFGGYASIHDSPLSPGHSEVKTSEMRPFDPEKSSRILDALGFDQKKNLRYHGRKPLSFELIFNEENRERAQIARNLQINLSNIGVNLEINGLPWESYLRRLNSGQYQIAILSWAASPGYGLAELFHSGSMETGLNFMHYHNPRVDALLDLLIQGGQPAADVSHLSEVQNIIMHDLPVTVLYTQQRIFLKHKNLHHVNLNQADFFSGIRNWQIADQIP